MSAAALAFRRWSGVAAGVLVSATIAGCAQPAGRLPFTSYFNDAKKSDDVDRFTLAKQELKDPVNTHLRWAQLQEHSGQLDEARDSYRFVLHEQPKSADALLGLARCDQLSGRTYEAEQGFRRALSLHPNDPHVLHNAGQFFASQKRWAEAIDLLQQSTAAAPEEKSCRFHLAVALARSGDFSSAMPHFVKTVGDAQAHYNVGYILYERGQLAAAEQQFLQAVVKEPQLKQAHEMLDRLRGEQQDKLILTGSEAAANPFGHRPPPSSAPARRY